jgi:Radical SAM superfamily
MEWNVKARVVGYTETTRGCKHTCTHCPITPIYQGRFFAVPADIVLEDIRKQVAQGAEHITFGDPDFLNGPSHALPITRALHREFPDVTFDATIKVEHLLKHRHLLPELQESGCAFVVSAVESLNDVVLRTLRKGHTSEDVAQVFDWMEEIGIALRPSLMPFSPWETLDSYIQLLTFFEERHLIEHVDPVHFSIRLLIPPGSAILATPGNAQWLGELDAAAYTYRWHHPDSRMDDLHSQIANLVEQAQRTGSDPIETFFSIKALALATNGQEMSISSAIQHYGARRVIPHLTESWFC